MGKKGKNNNEFKKNGILLMSGIVALGGIYYSGYSKANEVHENNIRQGRINQEVTQTELKGTKVDAMIDSINTKLQIVLLEQNETANIKLEKEDAKWNSWLTQSSVEVTTEMKSLIGIDTKDLMFVKTEKGLVVQYSMDDFEVLSLEVINENVLSSRKIFSSGYTDDDKTAIKKHIKEQTKEKILQNDKTMKQASKVLQDYLNEMGEKFGVNVLIMEK